jgi:hypothetical protein
MYKLFNILILLLILFFFLNVYKYYSSSVNIEIKYSNRNNINQIINDKISDLTVLNNDTNNVIEFNDLFSTTTKEEKKRSFWQLLKSR